MTNNTRALEIARSLGLAEAEVLPATADAVFHGIRDVVPQEVWKISLQLTGETGEVVAFWQIRGHFYLDDPTFAPGLIDFLDLDYNDVIGLHLRPGKSGLTKDKLPPPGTQPTSPPANAPQFIFKSNDPLNALYLALNHYISTGDHIGEGKAFPQGKQLHVLIPYAPKELEDKDNWERLKARLEQIRDVDKLPLRIASTGSYAQFVMMDITFAASDVPRLTQLLRAKPGPKGWGSLYSFMQQHGLADKGEA